MVVPSNQGAVLRLIQSRGTEATTPADVQRLLGLSNTTVHKHLRRLHSAGLIHLSGWRLGRADVVIHLYRAGPAPADVPQGEVVVHPTYVPVRLMLFSATKPMTAGLLAERIGRGEPAVRAALTRLKREGRAHVVGMQGNNRCWVFGAGEDCFDSIGASPRKRKRPEKKSSRKPGIAEKLVPITTPAPEPKTVEIPSAVVRTRFANGVNPWTGRPFV